MNKFFIFLFFFFAVTMTAIAQKRVLIFSKTQGFRHSSIEKGAQVLKQLLDKEKIASDHSEDAALFTDQGLKKYDAVIFLSTTGNILDGTQQEAFVRYIQSGKGFAGIHAATDTEFDWPWYNGLVGAYFTSHPAVQNAKIHVVNRKHIATKHLDPVWWHKDEWYNFKDVKEGLHVLMNLDEKSYNGGKMGDHHPISWSQNYDGGKVFYTGLGHTEESYDEPAFQKHLIGGILSVLPKK
ncbi:ThuA domain-containing protein [Sphingobacterium sp. BIGb0165]|uniref:ThuA domain-containing protein n=1 Tax=Sphingobacterium sp. BIGb0165 TaxID=2940615 RepID=UPI002167E098|nr:ThuA domain-containing protein [Sphingobacterium sp. BIGb0165]MCS4226039.1 type 1 glutamine amidotransferase [Sphingobacterium sp. BIGb0165]